MDVEIPALIAQISSDGLVDAARGFLLPIVLLVVGAVAVVFLISQRASQLVGFLLVAIFVVALLVNPGLIEDTGRWVGSLLRGGSA